MGSIHAASTLAVDQRHNCCADCYLGASVSGPDSKGPPKHWVLPFISDWLWLTMLLCAMSYPYIAPESQVDTVLSRPSISALSVGIHLAPQNKHKNSIQTQR